MTTKTNAPPMAEDHTARLAELREVEAQERHAQRDAEMALAPARAALVTAYDELVVATADRDSKETRSARHRHSRAQQAVADAQLAADAAERRAERAAVRRGEYEQDHADALLRELEPEARQIAEQLSLHASGLVETHERWRAVASAVNDLLRAHPSATPAGDGPPDAHGLEGAVREAQRAPTDPPAPLPRWLGVAIQEQRDKTHRLLRLKRQKKPSASQLAEIEQLRQELTPREVA